MGLAFYFQSKLTIMDVATAACLGRVQELLRKFIANPSSIDTLEDSPADSTQDPQPPQNPSTIDTLEDSPADSTQDPQPTQNPSTIDTLEDSPADSTQDPQPTPYIESFQKVPQYIESQEPPQSAESYHKPP